MLVDVLFMVVTYPDGTNEVTPLGDMDDYDREVSVTYPSSYIDNMGEEKPCYTYDDVIASPFVAGGGENMAKQTLYNFVKKKSIHYNGPAHHAPNLGLIKITTKTVGIVVA